MIRKKPRKDDKVKTLEDCWGLTPNKNDGSSVAGSSGKTPIASSRRVFKDVGNTPMRSEQIVQGASKIGDVKSEEDKEIEFKFIDDGDKREHVVRGKANESLYSALSSVDIVKELKKKRMKKLYLVGLRGKTAFNLGMPLKCLEENTTFEMRYRFGRAINSADHSVVSDTYRSYDAKDKQIVTFYVQCNATNNRKILFSTALPKNMHSVCVFAVKGESFRDALCKDGRFLPILKTTKWKVVAGNKAFLSKYSVDKYAKRTFSVEFSKKSKNKSPLSTANQTSEHLNSLAQETLKPFSQSLLNQYPHLQEQGTLIEEVLQAEAKMQKTTPKNLLILQKSEFGKKTVNSTAARVVRMLAQRLNSVGYIKWQNQENTGSATCFLLAGHYVLTCHHVIQMIVGEGVPEKDWARIVSSVASITFNYEGNHPPQDNFYAIEPWLGVSEKNLDYALLKLKGNRDTLPQGLISFIPKEEPVNGLVYLIGHPGSNEKTTDACTVIPFVNRHPEIRRRLHGEKLLHIFSPSSFWETKSPRVLTYDTSFFQGSSGSPVLNFSGQLVAMHSAGYLYLDKQKNQSVIEFGWLMNVICSDIESKDKPLYDLLIREGSLKNKDTPITGECNDINMESEENAEGCTSGEAMEVEHDRPPARKRKRSNLPE